MKNLRKYGSPPYKVAVVHGGPGAPGEMAPVARELSTERGILEPLQTASSLVGQVEELRALLEESGGLPTTLIGWSWGAWLSFILAAEHPDCVRKLILVSSGPFEEAYALDITATRLSRLDAAKRAELIDLTQALSDGASGNEDEIFARAGRLISEADSYSTIPHANEALEYRYQLYYEVWDQADELRRGGELLRLGSRIECPVVAIHGDYDPHPWQGVLRPLSGVIDNFHFVLLKDCGHYPWFEKAAREEFFAILEEELRDN